MERKQREPLDAPSLGEAAAATLAEPGALAGYTGDPGAPSSVLLSNHGLVVILGTDRDHPVGGADADWPGDATPRTPRRKADGFRLMQE